MSSQLGPEIPFYVDQIVVETTRQITIDEDTQEVSDSETIDLDNAPGQKRLAGRILKYRGESDWPYGYVPFEFRPGFIAKEVLITYEDGHTVKVTLTTRKDHRHEYVSSE